MVAIQGNSSPLQTVSDECFDTIRDFDLIENKYWLSASIANWYFERYTIAWSQLLNAGAIMPAAEIMERACAVAWDWEGRNSPYLIHKGTPYFFLGQTHLEAGNVDRAFLMIHNAIEEDKRNHPRLGLT